MSGVRTSLTDLAVLAERTVVFACPLVLMERTRARTTAVAAPSPDTMQAPINRFAHARTNVLHVVGRTQADDAGDQRAAHGVQDGYRLAALPGP
jgi:hypothetical protein